jgi:ribonuclease P/MRP protein subunit RPP1
MKFYDLHIHSAFSEGTSTIEQLVSTAKQLGYSGICFAEYFNNLDQIKKLGKEIERVKQKVGMEIFLGFEARNVKELAKLTDIRRKFDVLLVRGGDLKLNRLACETPEVDILTHPEYERFDSGLNHVLVKEAAKNNVAIEVNFREILITSKNSRSRVLHNIAQNIELAKKYHTPIILCSGAISHFELRSPECLISMANQLGLELNEAKNSISKVPENILKQAKERRSEKFVIPGVKVIK